MMSDRFLYSGDDAVMMSELQHCHVPARQCSGIGSESKAGLSVRTSLAPECGLTFLQEFTFWNMEANWLSHSLSLDVNGPLYSITWL